MVKMAEQIIENHKVAFFRFLNLLVEHEKNLFVGGELVDLFQKSLPDLTQLQRTDIVKVLDMVQEAVVLRQSVFLEIRERIALSEHYRFDLESVTYNGIMVTDYLQAKEQSVFPGSHNNMLTLNFKPFYKRFPSVRDAKSIGSGLEYLNRYLSSEMFNNPDKWKNLLYTFARLHSYDSEQLLMNDRIPDADRLTEAIDKALSYLNTLDDEEPFANIKNELQSLGFEKGLGSNAAIVADTLRMLQSLLESPDPESLKKFISRIPMIFNIVIVSVHGFFAQDKVLGLPDTGGQVVYILDQVKALEKEMIQSLHDAGLDMKPRILILTRLIPEAGETTCNERMEKVAETQNTWILRVPFRAHNPDVTNKWISRFEIYPYLEEFAEDAYVEILARLKRRPDVVIGNYTDGNVVATILARRWGVTQCAIAHALEKSKYLYSDLYWKSQEDQYHFSLQFTADLLAMNSADFVITSSYQEIAGTSTTIGQYESYKSFTMPELYRVEQGINLFHPKFNVVSPGVNENIYFPYSNEDQRFVEIRQKMEEMLFGKDADPEIRGQLKHPERTPIFTMARLDKIKNLTALVRWYGESKELQKIANLIVVAGKIDPEQSGDHEEKDQVHYMHSLMDQYNLNDHMRWIGKLFRKPEAGEVYRVIADHKGIFVQPALFEGFGLTVVEAMNSGLPVFVTQYGGPSEIVENGRSGFHIDPVNAQLSTDKIFRFVRDAQKEPKLWERISNAGINRVHAKYNWKLYSDRLLSLSKIYGFWKFSTNLNASELYAYLDSLYYLLYRPMAHRLLERHG